MSLDLSYETFSWEPFTPSFSLNTYKKCCYLIGLWKIILIKKCWTFSRLSFYILNWNRIQPIVVKKRIVNPEVVSSVVRSTVKMLQRYLCDPSALSLERSTFRVEMQTRSLELQMSKGSLKRVIPDNRLASIFQRTWVFSPLNFSSFPQSTTSKNRIYIRKFKVNVMSTRKYT